MGFSIHSTKFLVYARKRGVCFTRTATIGRQELHLSADALRKNLSDFGYFTPDAAALRIHTDAPSRLAVTARVARVRDSGTYALAEQAVAQSSALAAGGTATAIHMDKNSQTTSSFGFVEVSGHDAVVHVSVVDGSTGAELGANDYSVPAGNKIVANAADILGTATASNLYFRFSVTSGDGQVVAYGLATDTLSGDASLVIARNDP